MGRTFSWYSILSGRSSRFFFFFVIRNDAITFILYLHKTYIYTEHFNVIDWKSQYWITSLRQYFLGINEKFAADFCGRHFPHVYTSNRSLSIFNDDKKEKQKGVLHCISISGSCNIIHFTWGVDIIIDCCWCECIDNGWKFARIIH